MILQSKEINVITIDLLTPKSIDCNDNICNMSIEKLELLLNDTSEPFGHGLCLAYSLLIDLQSAFNCPKV